MFRKIFSSIVDKMPLRSKHFQEYALSRHIMSPSKRTIFFSAFPVDPYLILSLKLERTDCKAQQFIKEFLDGRSLLSLNKENDFGHTLVRFAALKGRKDVLEYLHMFDTDKLDIAGRDRYGRTALMLAVEAGHIDVVEYLLQTYEGAFLEDDFDHQGNNSGMLAAKRGHKAILQFLIKQAETKIDINETNNDGQNMLMLAARRGHYSVVEYLLTEYAGSINLYTKDDDGRSAFELAATPQIQDLIFEARRAQKAKYYLSGGFSSKFLRQP